MYRSGIRVVVVAGSFVKQLVAMNRLMRVLSLLKLSSNVSGVSIQGVPEKTHFQNATEHPQVKNGRTDPRAHSEIPIIMTTEGF